MLAMASDLEDIGFCKGRVGGKNIVWWNMTCQRKAVAQVATTSGAQDPKKVSSQGRNYDS